jgi:hypothetical protein
MDIGRVPRSTRPDRDSFANPLRRRPVRDAPRASPDSCPACARGCADRPLAERRAPRRSGHAPWQRVPYPDYRKLETRRNDRVAQRPEVGHDTEFDVPPLQLRERVSAILSTDSCEELRLAWTPVYRRPDEPSCCQLATVAGRRRHASRHARDESSRSSFLTKSCEQAA